MPKMPRTISHVWLLSGTAVMVFLLFTTAVLPARALSLQKSEPTPFNLKYREEPIGQSTRLDSPARLNGFDLLDDQRGWVWLDNQVYWTEDSGETWKDITPAYADAWHLAAVHFQSAGLGRILFVVPSQQGWAPFSLAVTRDAGRAWRFVEGSFPTLNEDLPPVTAYELWFLDDTHGWLVVKHLSSVNFSLGSVFITRDGGQSWQQAALPIYGTLYFSTPEVGWLAGGVTGNTLFHTQDGGETWSEIQQLPLSADKIPADSVLHIEDSPPVLLQQLMGKPVSNSEQVHGFLKGLGDDFQQVDFVTMNSGWAMAQWGNCSASGKLPQNQQTKKCFQTTDLKRTFDAGDNWQSLNLPKPLDTRMFTLDERLVTPQPEANQIDETLNLTGLAVGHGFDKCEVPTLSQLQTWRTASPYQSVNLYIGGVMRACDNIALNASFVNQARQQGWSFIPTWVGLQASCTDFRNKMSSDPATAYAQGVNEANAAIETAASLGLTAPDKTGGVIYYDLEYYNTTKTTCNEAAKAFINGWVTQMHTRNNIAGVYSNGPPLYHFSTIPNPPDVIWAAHWIYDKYNPSATVWNVYSLPNTLWANHQRLRQYAGGHSEKWGTVSMNVDSNVLDGIVSFPAISFENLTEQFFLPIIQR